MSPEKTSEGGQFRTDWQRKEVGRIRVSYGRTLKQHTKALRLLDELYENDQLDVLRALKKKKGEPGRVEIRELLGAKKAGRLRRDDVLIDLRLQRPLWSTLEELCAARPGGDTHRTNMRNFLKKLMSTTAAGKLGPKAVFADLMKIDWIKLQGEFSSPAYWNAVRKMVLTCAGALLENLHHQFRVDLMKKIDKLAEVQLETDVTTEQFWQLIDALPEHARPGVVTLAVTGMRLNTEYMACDASHLRPAVRAVFCPGSKTADATGFIYVAESLWPWVEAGIPAPVKSRWLRIYLHRAAAEVGLGQFTPRKDGAMESDGETPKLEYSGLTLGQLRHLALQLALDGGAQLNAVQAMARHADPKMTMRYLKRGNRKLAAEAIGRELEKSGVRRIGGGHDG